MTKIAESVPGLGKVFTFISLFLSSALYGIQVARVTGLFQAFLYKKTSFLFIFPNLILYYYIFSNVVGVSNME